MSEAGRRTNALANETSPYLLQHRHNPVDWLPWGDEAFARARALDKPVLLSVGYSACHWCHVMERESFEDERIAKLMNDLFVPVKVDREERPDVDGVYMGAVQAMTGQGGWPMTVFLTPDGEPFYGGTYFPPEDRYGRPGFPKILLAVHEAWRDRRDEVLHSARGLSGHLARLELPDAGGAAEADPAVASRAVQAMWAAYDSAYGGFGGAPKFPSPGALEFLLQHHVRTGSPHALEMAEGTLDGMARGGLYDQLGGGFARYSTDERWLAPHFEKMLYDNAQLARVYLHAWLLTGRPLYARVARETLDYALREMTSPEGGFYSAQDADSEGEEGKFYVWDSAQVERELGEDAALFSRAYGVVPGGNWEGRSILTLRRDPQEVVREFGLDAEAGLARLDAARRRLFELRSRRVWPGRDDKVIVGWNGLMLAALAEGGRVLGEARYLEAARANVGFVRRELLRDGRLRHTYKDGIARVHGMLDDYGLYGLGVLELYRSTFERSALELAVSLAETAVERFRDEGGFADTPDDAERLIVRPRSLFDAAMPSGSGSIALLLGALGHLTGRPEWERLALQVAVGAGDLLARQPTGFGSLLQVLEGALAVPREVAVIGELAAPEGRALVAQLDRRYLPHVAVAAGPAGEAYLPVLEGRDAAGGVVAAYVCENLACRLPVTTPDALAAALDRGVASPPGAA